MTPLCVLGVSDSLRVGKWAVDRFLPFLLLGGHEQCDSVCVFTMVLVALRPCWGELRQATVRVVFFTPAVGYACVTLLVLSAHTDVLEELQKYKIPVEPLVDAATNSARIQTRICRGMAPVCSYEDSILYPVRTLAEHEQRDNIKTKKAFSILTGYGEAQRGNKEGDLLSL